MDGSIKLPLFVIGKSKKLRAFKNVTVPVKYTAKKKAWMTGALFEDRMRKLDRRMRLESPPCGQLPSSPFHRNEQCGIDFFCHQTLQVSQPMNACIIKNLKFHYRFILANRCLETADNDMPFSWDILAAVIALKRAWMKVTSQTIANCYMNAIFKASEEAHLI